MTVPEDAETLTDLSLFVDGVEVPVDVIGRADFGEPVDPEDLDVTDGRGAPVRTPEAGDSPWFRSTDFTLNHRLEGQLSLDGSLSLTD